MLASLRNGGGLDCSLHGEEEEESGGDEPGPSVISDLISQGASLIAQTDRTGETALHLAARYARADAAKRLLDAGADPNAHDNMGRTPLHAAVAADAQGVFQVRKLFDLEPNFPSRVNAKDFLLVRRVTLSHVSCVLSDSDPQSCNRTGCPHE